MHEPTNVKPMTEEELELAVRQRRALSYLFSHKPDRFGLFHFYRGFYEVYAGVEFKANLWTKILKFFFNRPRKHEILFTYQMPNQMQFVDSYAVKEMIALGLTDEDLNVSGNFDSKSKVKNLGRAFNLTLEEINQEEFEAECKALAEANK